MTDAPSADDLARENEELRQQNGQLQDGLREVVRRQAAAEAGLDPRMARWVKGDTIEEAVADAQTLALQLDSQPAPPAPSSQADAIQQHLRERRDAAASMNPNQNQED